MRVSTGDPSPQVLAWADAFLLVCDISSRPSFQGASFLCRSQAHLPLALDAIQAKMNTFKRVGNLPVAIVGVHGLSASEEVRPCPTSVLFSMMSDDAHLS